MGLAFVVLGLFVLLTPTVGQWWLGAGLVLIGLVRLAETRRAAARRQ